MAPTTKRDSSRSIDPIAIGGALAMRQEGFSDADIEAVFGYMPPLHLGRAELFAALDAADRDILSGGDGDDPEPA